MIRILRLYSTFLPSDRDRMEQVKAIFRESFPDAAGYADKISDQLDHPFNYGYHAVLLVSEASLGQVSGFALCFLLPEINSANRFDEGYRTSLRNDGCSLSYFPRGD